MSLILQSVLANQGHFNILLIPEILVKKYNSFQISLAFYFDMVRFAMKLCQPMIYIKLQCAHLNNSTYIIMYYMNWIRLLGNSGHLRVN
jgi:hypothetical protein